MTAWDAYWITLAVLAVVLAGFVWIVREIAIWAITGRWEGRAKARRVHLARALMAGGLKVAAMVRARREKP